MDSYEQEHKQFVQTNVFLHTDLNISALGEVTPIKTFQL